MNFEKFKGYFKDIHISLAVALYIVTCVVLHIVEFVLYDRAVVTVYWYVLVYPPLFLVAHILFRNRKLKRDRRELRARMMGLFGTIIFVICVVVGYNFISGEEYRDMSIWQILGIVMAISAFGLLESKRDDMEKKVSRIDYISIAFSTLLVFTVAFLLITAPLTVGGAGRLLAAQGRTDAVFMEHHTPESEFLPESSGPIGAYLFKTANGAEIWVDVASGEILE